MLGLLKEIKWLWADFGKVIIFSVLSVLKVFLTLSASAIITGIQSSDLDFMLGVAVVGGIVGLLLLKAS